MGDIAVKVEGLGKEYQIGIPRSGDLRENISRRFTHLLGKKVEGESFWALSDVTFEIKRGEAVGIIGRNGAGKSTLLKILSRITQPTQGRIEINGRVSSLLEVGTGFHPELTGRENVYLNGTILGMRRAEIKGKFDEIVAFSGVEGFIDTAVKHYSSGMKVRLAFSVAAHLEPDILIIDEVLAVGDAEFQNKCLGKMEDVTDSGRTVLFVSHNMGAVQRLCTSGILLENGTIRYCGEINDVLSKYLIDNSFNQEVDLDNFPRAGIINEGLKLKYFRILTQKAHIVEGDPFEVEIEFYAEKDLEDVVMGFSLSDGSSTIVEARSSSHYQSFNIKQGVTYKAKANVKSRLVAGIYQLNVGARYKKGNLEYVPSVSRIEILSKRDLGVDHWNNPVAGKVLIDQIWTIQ